MSAYASMSSKLSFRKIGNRVFVKGALRYSDAGTFINDAAIGAVPAGMAPGPGYGTYDCMFPLAQCNGSGTQNRLYIKPDGGICFAGTSGATSAILATGSYLTD